MDKFNNQPNKMIYKKMSHIDCCARKCSSRKARKCWFKMTFPFNMGQQLRLFCRICMTKQRNENSAHLTYYQESSRTQVRAL